MISWLDYTTKTQPPKSPLSGFTLPFLLALIREVGRVELKSLFLVPLSGPRGSKQYLPIRGRFFPPRPAWQKLLRFATLIDIPFYLPPFFQFPNLKYWRSYSFLQSRCRLRLARN